ncbi:MAG: helix-turn-helix domain-containing protein [Bacteroidaceae bacterium]|nr:helix-turn-helix domain-containing protein [Bacteroidaceae bacterium]
MRKTKKCAFCGKEFTCNSGSQRYCSEHCAEAAKAQRKKKQQDFLKAVQPVIDIASQEYLTFSKAAILMGCSRQYVYKLVNEGKLPASRISSRMAFIRKADIETMLAGNPYHRVLPTHKPMIPSSLSLKKGRASSKPTRKGNSVQNNEPLEYISGEEVMATYKVKKSWLYASAKRNNIPVCKIAGKNYYSRKHMDALFGVTAEIEALTDWLTTDEAESLYSTTKESLRTQAYRRHIPTKREYGKTYYSKIHLDEVYHPDLKASDAYYTTVEAAEKYGMTKSNICVIVKTNNLTKVKVGVHYLIAKEELDRIMASRLAQFGAYRLQ